MHTTNLRKMGGSVMLAVPPAILELLQVGIGDAVDIGVESGRLIIQPRVRPRYTLGQLLAQCTEMDAPSDQDRAWIDAKPIGEEIL